ncbi:MAG: hypothetical protein ACQSGP_05770 [Frankia sp.]
MVKSIFRVPAEEVEARSTEGWLFFVPVIPFTPEAIGEAVQLLRAEARKAGSELIVGHTLNILPESWVDVVVSIRFPRLSGSAARAHFLLSRLHERFTAAGFHLYRVDVDYMGAAPVVRADPGQERLLRQPKTVLDQHDVLSRGRYV